MFLKENICLWLCGDERSRGGNYRRKLKVMGLLQLGNKSYGWTKQVKYWLQPTPRIHWDIGQPSGLGNIFHPFWLVRPTTTCLKFIKHSVFPFRLEGELYHLIYGSISKTTPTCTLVELNNRLTVLYVSTQRSWDFLGRGCAIHECEPFISCHLGMTQ